VGVDSAVARLGTDAAGVLVPPEDFGQAGWFSGGPAPGETGPAVLAGHVDSWTGPAVFFRLDEIAVGAEVLVDRADGTTVPFVVTRVGRYAKDDFPTGEVYGPTTGAELRVVTCGGAFDQDRRSYRDNVVVYARSAPPPV
jgi:sortase (surface protein transpeptidase)